MKSRKQTIGSLEAVGHDDARQVQGGMALNTTAIGWDGDWCGTQPRFKFPPKGPFPDWNDGGLNELVNFQNVARF